MPLQVQPMIHWHWGNQPPLAMGAQRRQNEWRPRISADFGPATVSFAGGALWPEMKHAFQALPGHYRQAFNVAMAVGISVLSLLSLGKLGVLGQASSTPHPIEQMEGGQAPPCPPIP
ncbi:MAG: hypothetical protein U0003_03020 [Vampirovibrionales bacterium]